jgi:hypothetical protein
MGAIITGLVGAGAAAGLTELDTVLIKTQRSIAGIFPDVTIEEDHTDELEITHHPVEGGFTTDNAFKKPSRLIMRCGWSDSKPGLLGNQFIGIGLEGAILEIYRRLRGVQELLEPFTVITGKRTYQNMMMAGLRVTTNVESENSLMAEISFEQVIIVQTQSATLPPMAVQTEPEKTADTVNSGTVQPKQVNQSILKTILGPFDTPVAPPFVP